MRNKQRYCWQVQNHVRIANFGGGNRKTTIPSKSSYFFMVLWYGRSCQEMCGTILRVGKQNDSTTLQSVNSMPWRPSLQKRRIEIRERIVRSMLSNCSEMLLLGRPDILWSVNKLARSITKWTKACHKRLSRLISYIHYTSDYKQYCRVGHTAKQCRLGLFQDSDFARYLEDSKSTSGGTLCIFGSHTFVPISWKCKKQTSVSHSSTESQIISLDASLWMDGKPALDLWDLIVSVLHGNTNQSKQIQGDLSTPLTRKKIPGKIDDLNSVEFVSSNANSSHKEAMLYIFEDDEGVIKIIIKGRSPTMRYVSRPHRVPLDWLFESIWTPRSTSNTLTPRTNSQTHWPREISHVMSGTIFCFCSTLAMSASSTSVQRGRKEHKKMHVKKMSQQNQSRWWIWCRDAV